ncbi:MAG TPA: glycosyltransferase [Anaeromyxobacter sp.]|nr:glycosyltransferase [Anaeromyxobacter sp.]
MKLDVVICTHTPRASVLDRVIEALARQTARPPAFRVLLIDNASSPPVAQSVLNPLSRAGIDARIVVEPVLGLPYARLRALAETTSNWVLFVDDDNELAERFVEEGLAFLEAHRRVGAFGGKLLLPSGLALPAWKTPFLTYLGIKDAGDSVLESTSDNWGPWEPPGAGLFVRREVLQAYADRVSRDPRGLLLGRRGNKVLSSCDDSFLVRQAPRLGFALAYVPQLKLVHHLEPHRLRYSMLLRLLVAFGSSLALLDALVHESAIVPPQYRGWFRRAVTAWHGYRVGRRRSHRFGLAMVGHHLAAGHTWAQLRERR